MKRCFKLMQESRQTQPDGVKALQRPPFLRLRTSVTKMPSSFVRGEIHKYTPQSYQEIPLLSRVFACPYRPFSTSSRGIKSTETLRGKGFPWWSSCDSAHPLASTA